MRFPRTFGWAVVLAAAVALAGDTDEGQGGDPADVSAIPVDSMLAYKVEYLGITCGHMTLESRLEDYRGKPAYHMIMTARNSKFFNQIYRLDGRIESWVDAETTSTLVYISDITIKGEREIKRYTIDREAGVVLAEENGEKKTVPFDGAPALDPLAFIYRGRVLAGKTGTEFPQPILIDRGSFETISTVGESKRFDTADGKRELLPIRPMPTDKELYSGKGKVVYWIDPGPGRKLYRLDAKLGWGRLVAKLTGPAEEVADRRGIKKAGE